MLSFLTLFLGLVVGPQTIGLTASDSVTAIELFIDGSRVSRLDSPPWVFEWDFGADLLPHEVTAVAFDEEGEEIDRVEQLVNGPRKPAEAFLVVTGDEEGESRSARLLWESIAGSPTELEVVFDGVSLDASDPDFIPLPPHDPEQLHYLQTRLRFADGIEISSELTFGGSYLDLVSSRLTAVPIILEGRKRLNDPSRLEGWFRNGSDELDVVAVERGGAEILVIRDPSALADLRRLREEELSKPLPSRFWRRSSAFGSQDWSLRFIWASPRPQVGSLIPFDLFAYSEPEPSESGSLQRWLLEVEPPAELKGRERLADAVAVAGVAAASKPDRRVVLLVLGSNPGDSSLLTAKQVRDYLGWLRVPLVIWSTGPRESDSDSWGAEVDISTGAGLERAFNQLFETLKRQRVVWFSGDHHAHDIDVTARADGIRMAY